MANGPYNYSLIEIKIQPRQDYDEDNDQLYVFCLKSQLKG
jgi:hypothetical protein